MKKVLPTYAALVCLLFSNAAFSQQPTFGNSVNGSACDVVVENFSTDPTFRGYSFAGFNYRSTGLLGQGLYIDNVVSNTSYSFYTPAYRLAHTGILRFGFNLITRPGSNDYFVNGNNIALNVQIVAAGNNAVLATYSYTLTAGGIHCLQMQDADLRAGTSVRYLFRYVSSANISGSRILKVDNFTSSSNQQITLPVNFTGITASKSGSSNQIVWQVASEENVDRYEVERNVNGNFVRIGNVAANGQPEYRFSDASPLSGNNSYRVKAVDHDGSSRYSPVVQLKSSGSSTQFRAFPSPATSTLTIDHDAVVSGNSLQICSIDGRVVKTVVPGRNSQRTELSLAGMKAGMYFVRYQNRDGETETLKFIKQ